MTGELTPALGLERQVVHRIREIGRDPELIAEVVRQARAQLEERRQVIRKERRRPKSSPTVKTSRIRESCVAATLAQFDGVWDALQPRERAHVFGLLVERVDYVPDRQIALHFRPS